MIVGFDQALLGWLQANCHTALLDSLMVLITTLGNGGLIWLVLAGCLLCSKKYRKIGICMFLALSIGFLLGNVLLKNIVARPRPCQLDPWTPLLIAAPKDFSFPSGHSLSSFAAATVLFCFHKQWGIAAGVLAGLIAFSRLYLYVHFPSDVFCGILLGIAIGWVVGYGYRYPLQHKKE